VELEGAIDLQSANSMNGIHDQRLNVRRNERTDSLKYIDPDTKQPEKITSWECLVEGWGAIFIGGFMISLIVLAYAVLKIMC